MKKNTAQNWYDVWFPNLSPSPQTLKLGQAATIPSEWKTFFRKYRAEMTTPENGKTLDLLAALSHETNFPWAVIAPTKRTVTDLRCAPCFWSEARKWNERTIVWKLLEKAVRFT
jgi:uncharacterized protein YeaO (DUF488 family)